MKKYLLSVLAFCAIATSGKSAVIISITSGTTTPTFSTSTGTLIPDGSLLRIGTFATEPAANSTFAELNALFQDFAFSTTGHTAGAGANKGLINRTSIPGDSGGQPDSFFVAPSGKSVYIWVYNEAGQAAITSATAQQGVFKSTTGVFVDDPLGAATSVSASSFRTAYGVGATAASVTANAGNTATASFRLAAPIPEPSSSLLVLGGVLGLLARRRK